MWRQAPLPAFVVAWLPGESFLCFIGRAVWGKEEEATPYTRPSFSLNAEPEVLERKGPGLLYL